jgi:predicted metalloprotease
VIGHEWGHLNDAVLGLRLPTTFASEQHADCQAGFASAAAEAAGLLTQMDLTIGYQAMCRAGGTSGWYDPTEHGDCAQRQNAFNVGYSGALQSLDAACGSDPLSAMRRVCG